MNIVATSSHVRPYYLLSPTTENIYFVAQNVGPHGQTERVGYTPISGEYVYVEHIYLFMRRTAAPSTADFFLNWVTVVDDGLNEAIIARIESNISTVGTAGLLNIPCNILLKPGNEIIIYTMDSSTGGTVTYGGTIRIVHFTPPG